MLQQIALGGMMIALPISLRMVLEYSAMLSCFRSRRCRSACSASRSSRGSEPVLAGGGIIRFGFALLVLGLLVLIPIVPRADSGWWLLIPLLIAGSGLGLMVSRLNNYTLSPISEERVSEAAGVNSAAGSFGLSFGLAFAGAIMLATLSSPSPTWRSRARCSRRPNSGRSQALDEDAEVMSNTQLEELLVGQPEDVQARSSPSTRMRGRSRFRWR